MKRRWNIFVWIGLLLILAGVISYLPIFVRFPVTRDFPWVNLLLIIAGLGFVAAGLERAFRQPKAYRGKVSGAITGALGVVLLGLFLFGIFYLERQLPASHGAPQVGQKAPDFTLPDQDGNSVSLSSLLASPPNGSAAAKTTAVVLIFYRGYW